MYNQIRAEFYKLFHTKALYLTFALILAVFGIFSIGGQQQFVVSSSSVDETWKIGEGVFMIKNSTQSLDEMDINLLFSKFYTVDKSRTKGGSGLGLYIVKELLKKIDGKIGNIEYNKPILSITLFFRLFK